MNSQLKERTVLEDGMLYWQAENNSSKVQELQGEGEHFEKQEGNKGHRCVRQRRFLTENTSQKKGITAKNG